MQVFISLRRPSDQEMSEPKPFLYLPQEFGRCMCAHICRTIKWIPAQVQSHSTSCTSSVAQPAQQKYYMSACTSWSVLGRGVRHPYMYIITFKLSTNDPRQYMYVSIFSLFALFSLRLSTPSIHFPRLSSPFLPSLSLSFLLSLSSLFLLPLFSLFLTRRGAYWSQAQEEAAAFQQLLWRRWSWCGRWVLQRCVHVISEYLGWHLLYPSFSPHPTLPPPLPLFLPPSLPRSFPSSSFSFLS